MELIGHVLFVLVLLVVAANSAPIDQSAGGDVRQKKSLNVATYFDDYNQQFTDFNDFYQNNNFYDYEENEFNFNDDQEASYDDNELSRTIPKRNKIRQRPPQYNSPIYYIRLPPQPYIFMPGLGYVSQPPQHPQNQFFNLPVSFLANGKPASIYQWNAMMPQQQQQQQQQQPQMTPPQQPQQLHKPSTQNSKIHRLPGSFAFNGKPEDVFVLRDSYNSLYSDALQNFYP